MDSIETLIKYYNNSQNEDIYHGVIEQILKNLPKIETATIYDLADVCYTSSSTISRLVKKLQFTNYQDFRSKIIYALKNYGYLNRNMKNIEVIENSDVLDLYFNFLMNNLASLKTELDYETISRISDCLDHAQKAVFFSIQGVPLDVLQKARMVLGKHAILCDDNYVHENILSIIDADTLVFALVPNFVEMSFMRSILRKAKDKEAKIVIICSGKKNECLKYGDITISFMGTETSMDLYLFQAVVNVIKYDYNHRYVDGKMEALFE